MTLSAAQHSAGPQVPCTALRLGRRARTCFSRPGLTTSSHQHSSPLPWMPTLCLRMLQPWVDDVRQQGERST